jgi:hypothetical protein
MQSEFIKHADGWVAGLPILTHYLALQEPIVDFFINSGID